ncbi:hypothetical protein FQR65_LT01132 [Abscondita terminalis]|nr:hypothetical protein FQR65_LT01132 [Abscondita terminalis]
MFRVVYLFIVFICVVLSNETDDVEEDGSNFSIKYTSNGFTREETGKMMVSVTGDEVFVITGYYSYIGPNGKLNVRHYTCDDEGCREFSLRRINTNAIISLQGGGLG